MKTLIAVILVSLLLYACSRSPELKPNRTAEQYFSHLANTPDTAEEDVAKIFGKIFTNFKLGATEENIRATYAEDLYFNDTFKIIEDLDVLVEYMSKSANSVESTHVDILEVIPSQHDYFIRWSMEMNFKVQGKDIHSQSIGITQLRFNEDGKVVFHQDFWDSSEAFYEHLPYLGRFVKKVKTML